MKFRNFLRALLVIPIATPGTPFSRMANANQEIGVPVESATNTVYPMLRVEWSLGPNLPQGLQDSDGGILGDQLITVGGFCSGGLERDNKEKPGVYPRGFLKKGWALDLSNREAGWRALPDFPGEARQGLSSALVGDSLYFWGGFSYTEPYCYADGWRLTKRGEAWVWDPLPPFPGQIMSPAMTTVGSKIYAFGGGDYDAQAFYTEADRAGERKRLGARLLVFDTERMEEGWKELEPCPGTARFVHSAAVVDGKIYVIGGATGNVVREGTTFGTCTVVDNWMFDLASGKWTRLRDLPIASGNFPRSSNAVFANRFILLPGGYQYGYVLNPDGTIRPPYGKPSSANKASGLYHDFFVYDTKTGNFGTADPLPIDNNLPMTVVRDNEVFLLGGETGGGVVLGEYYGHHPDLLLIGKISELETGK